ncbi:hypothetical protein GS454_23695 [Rhodococcus hoagii]|nr:hypothetical protein [Prescottella equi]
MDRSALEAPRRRVGNTALLGPGGKGGHGGWPAAPGGGGGYGGGGGGAGGNGAGGAVFVTVYVEDTLGVPRRHRQDSLRRASPVHRPASLGPRRSTT